jgi:hypothetical protein
MDSSRPAGATRWAADAVEPARRVLLANGRLAVTLTATIPGTVSGYKAVRGRDGTIRSEAPLGLPSDLAAAARAHRGPTPSEPDGATQGAVRSGAGGAPPDASPLHNAPPAASPRGSSDWVHESSGGPWEPVGEQAGGGGDGGPSLVAAASWRRRDAAHRSAAPTGTAASSAGPSLGAVESAWSARPLTLREMRGGAAAEAGAAAGAWSFAASFRPATGRDGTRPSTAWLYTMPRGAGGAAASAPGHHGAT